MTKEDTDLINEYVTEMQSVKGISNIRANTITYELVTWRKIIGPYQQNALADIYQGINALKTANSDKGKSFMPNIIHDSILFLKQYYLIPIEYGRSINRSANSYHRSTCACRAT